MATEPEFSIILCTRNRAELLVQALESLRVIDYPVQDVELVLVDNGSTDTTRAVAQAAAARFPFALRYVHESTPGLSVARNHGISESRGRYLLFTDDDQLVDAKILREFSRVRATYQARVIQGAIELSFTGPPPAWLHGPLATYLGKTPDHQEGPMPGDLHGGNMLLCRGLFENEQGFREDLGKGRAGYCEDTEISRRLRAMGEVVYFAPRAVQRHVIGPDRMNMRFLRRTSFQKGFSHGLLETDTPLLQACHLSLVEAWRDSRRVMRARLRSDEAERVLREVRALYEIGRALGYLKQWRRN